MPEGRYTLGARPEHLRLGSDGMFHWRAKLVEPLGKDTLLYFDVGMERPFVTVSEGIAMAELESGAKLGLTLARDQICLFAPDGRRIGSGA